MVRRFLSQHNSSTDGSSPLISSGRNACFFGIRSLTHKPRDWLISIGLLHYRTITGCNLKGQAANPILIIFCPRVCIRVIKRQCFTGLHILSILFCNQIALRKSCRNAVVAKHHNCSRCIMNAPYQWDIVNEYSSNPILIRSPANRCLKRFAPPGYQSGTSLPSEQVR